MAHMTTLDELKQHITVLASMEETDALVISVYLNLENGSDSWREALDKRAHKLRRILKGDDLIDLEEALLKVEAWLSTELLPDTKGVALFTRSTFGGSFILPMQFAAPLPNMIVVYPTPNIYHLMELKDDYHRYVILLVKPERACILEVNLGAATIEAWINEPEQHTRRGHAWSRSRYQVNQQHRDDRFIQGKIKILQQLMQSGGHTHFILAGKPEITERIRHALPDDLLDKLVDVIPASERDQQNDVVMATLSSFIEYEEQESQSLADLLIQGLQSQNLAVAGSAETLDALRWGEVDTLVISSDYQPDPGWSCSACSAIGIEPPTTSSCPKCGSLSSRPVDIREAILRLAGQVDCPVEVVEHSDPLMSLGGVGCLLRTQHEIQIQPDRKLAS